MPYTFPRTRVPAGYKDYEDALLYIDVSVQDIRGCSTGNNAPSAICVNNITFFVWADCNGDIAIVSAIGDAAFSVPVILAVRATDYPSGSDVEHSLPSLIVDNYGYIYVFYGAHDSQLYFRKSTNPYDISTWDAKQTITAATLATYIKPIVLPDNTIIITYRQGTAPTKTLAMQKTTDGGVTWSAPTTLYTDTGYWAYHFQGVGKEFPIPSIHIAINPRQEGGTFGKLIYMKSLDGGVTWKKADGSAITLPATLATATDVAAGSYPAHVGCSSAGVPYIAYKEFGNNNTKFAKWNGSSWTVSLVTTLATFQYELPVMDIISDSVIDIYNIAGVYADKQGGNIKRYRSKDGGATFSLAETLNTDGDANRFHVGPTLVFNHNDHLKLIWTYGDPVRGHYGKAPFARMISYP